MSERCLAVITPMKPLRQAKRRLRPALEEDARQALARAMLIHVLATVRASGVANLACVVSADVEVLALAAAYNFTPIPETAAGYNQAITEGAAWARAQGASELLTLPGDLPTLTAADIINIVRLADAEPAVIIAPDSVEGGTNALFLRPLDLLTPAFGSGSFARHCALARAAGVEPTIYRSPTLAHDIDLPEDLRYLSAEILTG